MTLFLEKQRIGVDVLQRRTPMSEAVAVQKMKVGAWFTWRIIEACKSRIPQNAFELAMIGDDLLVLQIEDSLEELVLAWKSCLTTLAPNLQREPGPDHLYTQVLNSLREQEQDRRFVSQTRIQAFQQSVEALGKLVRDP